LKCKVCAREAQTQPPSKYCERHQKAYESLQKKFEVWKEASNITWENYLEEAAKNPLTGLWARELAENLLSDQTRDDC